MKEIKPLARAAQPTSFLDAAASVIPPHRVAELARSLGVVTRQRKVCITALVWTLALGLDATRGRSLEALRVAYERVTGRSLVRSSFYARLTPQLAELIRRLTLEALGRFGGAANVPAGYLAGFRDVLAIDATVLRLHDLLSRRFAACRTNHTAAAAKLHMVMSVVDGSPNRVKLTSERVADSIPWRRVGGWVRDRLLLFDLGYYKFHLFDRVDANGGYFVSRAKTNANWTIVAANRRWRGRAVPVVGHRLQGVLARLSRSVLDVDVELTFKCRKYKGRQSLRTRRFRLVAIYNPDAKRYHCYLTNIPAERLTAEDITATYALRWQVELLFKAMKQHGRLGQLNSSKPGVVLCLIWSAVLAQLASRAIYRLIRQAVPKQRYIPLLRWAAALATVALDVLKALLTSDHRAALDLERHLRRNAPDPNITRKHRALAPVFLGFSA